MPNIRSQKVGAAGIEIVASDGRSVTITRAQIRSQFLAETGSLAARRAAVIAWVKSQIQTALGAEQVPVARIGHDFAEGDGTPTFLEVTS